MQGIDAAVSLCNEKAHLKANLLNPPLYLFIYLNPHLCFMSSRGPLETILSEIDATETPMN